MIDQKFMYFLASITNLFINSVYTFISVIIFLLLLEEGEKKRATLD